MVEWDGLPAGASSHGHTRPAVQAPDQEDSINPTPVLLSWSGGKDCALALARLRADPAVEVMGLLTTVTAQYERISIHGVRRELLHLQAAALGLPVHEIAIAPCSSNEEYEAAWRSALSALPGRMGEAPVIAFGDISLQDVRQYREDLVRALGFQPLFPLWGEPTRAVAEEILTLDFGVRVVCVDTEALPAELAGSLYDASFLDRLPAGVDPCGEHGEFHTFVSSGPGFRAPVRYRVGPTVIRDGRFAYCDLVPDDTTLRE